MRMFQIRDSGFHRALLGVPLLCVCGFVVAASPASAYGEDASPEEVAKAREDHLLRAPWWAFLDSRFSRKEVRQLLVEWVGTASGEGVGLGGDGGRSAVQSWIKILDRMLQEDAAHKPPARPLAELPAAERIAELIFRLRDVTGAGVFTNGGPPDVFAIPGHGEPTAADLLAQEGHAAIPALIDTLGDERLTRCAGDPRGGGNPMVTRVGDAAAVILSRIAGRYFWPPPGTMPAHDFGASLRPVVQAWWDAVQEKGEFLATADELVAEPVVQVDLHVAKRLAALDPHAAAPFIVRVTREVEDPLLRKTLLDVLGGLPGPGVLEFLRRELEHGPFLVHRVCAAFWLRDRGEEQRATAAIRAAWRRPLDFGTHSNSQWVRWTVRAGVHQIAAFLASSKDPDVVAELGVEVSKRPAHIRAVVAQMLGGGVVEYQLMGYFGTYRHIKGVQSIDNEAARRVLRALLDDEAHTGRLAHPSGSPGDTRVADLAAAALARREPAMFRFTAKAAVRERDKAIDSIRAGLDTPTKGD